jgi:hypothetical protein
LTFRSDDFPKPVVAAFAIPDASSDGGAILFRSVDTHFGLTKRLAACLDDDRWPGKIQHQPLEVLQQGGVRARLRLRRRNDRGHGHGAPSAAAGGARHATVTFNGERDQFAVAAVLRPGNAPAVLGARGILRRLLAELRDAFPRRRWRCVWMALPTRSCCGFSTGKRSSTSSLTPESARSGHAVTGRGVALRGAELVATIPAPGTTEEVSA